jgi:integrase
MTDATTVLTHYRPPALAADATEFARHCVAGCLPLEPARVKALLFATGRLGAFCASVGLELSVEVCLHPSVIERFIATNGASWGPATRRTVRTNLRFVAAQLLHAPSPLALSRERAKSPYSEAQIAAYLALGDAQSTLARRHRLAGLICLGAGAGLRGHELRHVTGHDVVRRSGGVVVEVAGRRPRTVPVLAAYHGRLLDAAHFAHEHYVTGGVSPQRLNVTGSLTRVARSTSDLAPLDTGRLRSTWLVAMAELLGLKSFMDAAGIICSQRLGDLIAFCGPLDEEEIVARLGGHQ